MYSIVRRFFFLFDAEQVHYFAMNTLRFICSFPFGKNWMAKLYTPTDPKLATNFLGMTMRNPVGLAAGFDKNAKYLNELDALGFGFVEIGTVTPIAQDGNEKPRLFRLPKDKAIINRMGFNNDGVDAVVERLKVWRSKNANSKLIVGGNIGKNKVTANEDAWKDYAACFEKLFALVDYFVVNVSSPNTPGLRELQEKPALHKILTHLQSLNAAHSKAKPLLLKIAPDLSEAQLIDVVDLAVQIKLDGLVVSNTTLSRADLKTEQSVVEKIGAGGLSGLPLQQRSTDVISFIEQQTAGQLPIIGSGGIFSATDAKQKIKAGASLIQVWTGFIYEGPTIAKNICKNWGV
jgi:dihydroorotate dehydrogenase